MSAVCSIAFKQPSMDICFNCLTKFLLSNYEEEIRFSVDHRLPSHRNLKHSYLFVQGFFLCLHVFSASVPNFYF